MSDDAKLSRKNPDDEMENIGEDEDDEEDLEALKKEIARMEEEAARISKEAEERGSSSTKAKGDDKETANDACSIYVGQVDYSTTPEELVEHFKPCGALKRVTIVVDRHTAKPKGFAYIEFEAEDSVENAIKLDQSEFKGRQLKVTRKRVNEPGFVRGGRGRGFRGGGRSRGFRGRGRRGGFRGGGGGRYGGFHPYY